MFLTPALRLALTLHGATMASTPPWVWAVKPSATVRKLAENCGPLQEPKRLPSVNALFDSAALVLRLGLLTGLNPSPSVFSVNASSVSGRPVESAQSSVRDSMLAAVLASLRPSGPSTPPIIRVRVQMAPALQITLERSVLCAPEPQGEQNTEEKLLPVVLGDAQTGEIPGPVIPILHISKTGSVLKVEFGAARVRGGGALFQRALMENRYRPALLDGEPVEVVWQPGKRLELAK